MEGACWDRKTSQNNKDCCLGYNKDLFIKIKTKDKENVDFNGSGRRQS